MVIALSIGITILAGWQALDIRFAADLIRFFPPNRPEIQFFKQYQQYFPRLENKCLIGIRPPNSILDPQTLKSLVAVTDSIEALPQIKEVRSLSNISWQSNSPFGLLSFPYIHPENPEFRAEDSMRITHSPVLKGILVSHDFKSLALQFTTDSFLVKTQLEAFADHLSQILKSQGFEDYCFAGLQFGQAHIINKMKVEMSLFFGMAVLLVLITFWLIYRAFWPIVSPLLIVLFTAIWVVGSMAFMEKSFDLLSSLIPAILFVIGVSDVIHIYARYTHELRLGTPKLPAIQQAYKEVGRANFFTSATTAVGFLSLTITDIKPIADFGIFTALGVMYAFVLSLTLFPALLVLIPPPQKTETHSRRLFQNHHLEKFLLLIQARRKWILASIWLILAAGFFALSQLKVNNYLLEELPEGDELAEDYGFFETHFSGVKSMEVAIEPASASLDLLSYDLLKQMDTLSQFISRHYDTKAIISPASLIRRLNQAQHQGDPGSYQFPDKQEFNRIKPLLRLISRTPGAKPLITEDKNMARLSAGVKDMGGFIMRQKHQNLLTFTQTNCPDLKISHTGMAHIFDIINWHVSLDLFRGLGFAFLLVGLMMGLLFRSLRMLLIALLVNVLPLLMTVISMYTLGIDLKMSTALIFTIAFGIAVDDSIHFLSKVRWEMNQGKSAQEAVRSSFISTGRAILLTTVVLFAGFASLAFSSFSSTYYMGLLISLTLLYAVVVDLVVLSSMGFSIYLQCFILTKK